MIGICAGGPLNYVGLMERITLLPLNYTRYDAIIVYIETFCRVRESGIIIIKVESEKNSKRMRKIRALGYCISSGNLMRLGKQVFVFRIK